MKLLKMHYTNPISWVFMPQLLQRARDFAEKLNLDLNPDLTEEMIRIHFVAKNPFILCWCAVEGTKVVGHVVTSIDTLANYEGVPIKRYLTILQAECNCADDWLRDTMMSELKDWAVENHCDDVQLLCENEWRVKLFRDRYGFHVDKTIMKLGGLQ